MHLKEIVVDPSKLAVQVSCATRSKGREQPMSRLASPFITSNEPGQLVISFPYFHDG
jgi:hypothetical protein